MYKICKDCGKKCDLSEKKCPVCGGKLKKQFTEEELKDIQEQNDENIYLLLKKGFTASLFVVNPFMPSE